MAMPAMMKQARRRASNRGAANALRPAFHRHLSRSAPMVDPLAERVGARAHAATFGVQVSIAASMTSPAASTLSVGVRMARAARAVLHSTARRVGASANHLCSAAQTQAVARLMARAAHSEHLFRVAVGSAARLVIAARQVSHGHASRSAACQTGPTVVVVNITIAVPSGAYRIQKNHSAHLVRSSALTGRAPARVAPTGIARPAHASITLVAQPLSHRQVAGVRAGKVKFGSVGVASRNQMAA